MMTPNHSLISTRIMEAMASSITRGEETDRTLWFSMRLHKEPPTPLMAYSPKQKSLSIVEL